MKTAEEFLKERDIPNEVITVQRDGFIEGNRVSFLMEEYAKTQLPKEGEEVYMECHFKDSTHRAIEHGTGIGDDPIRKILLPAKEEEAAKIRYDMAVEHWHSLTKNKLKGKDESERQGEIVATFIECLKIAAGL